ncbi:MAG: hypothetical protein ABFD18_06490 [Syntrophomonas sp.]
MDEQLEVKKPIFKKWWFWGIAIVAIFVMLMVAGGATIWEVSVLIGMIGLFVGIIGTLVTAIKKNPVWKRWAAAVGIALLLVVAGGINGDSTSVPTSATPGSDNPLEVSNQAYIKGAALFSNKDYEQTIEILEDVIPEDPHYNDAQSKISEAKEIIANTYLSDAKTQASSNDYDTALNSLNKAVSYNPGLTEASNLIPVVQQQKQAYLEQLKQQEIANYKSSCQSLAYKVLNKNPDGLIGTKVMLHGQILQIQEDAGSTFMLLQVTSLGYDMWTDNVAISYSGAIDAYEDDIITIWGEVTGAFSYKSTAGWDLTVPGVEAKYVQ